MKAALLTNGPGELQGWVRPLAAELSKRGHAIDVWILPCQYSSGREREIAASMDVGDVIGPLPFFPMLREMSRRTADVIVQLGGDLVFGRFLSWRRHIPLVCYAYGPKKGMDRCDLVATAYPRMAESLRVRSRRLFLAGDLVRDTVRPAGGGDADEGTATGRRSGKRIIVFPGSRKGIREASLQFVENVFRDVREEFPDVEIRILLHPFADSEEYGRWEAAGLTPSVGSSADAMSWADLAVTQPGTNTLELMHSRVPFLVVAPFSFIPYIPVSGVWNLLRVLPGGNSLVRRILSGKRRASPFVSWPNRIAGHEVVGELVGDVVPADVAGALKSLLRNPDRLRGIRDDLGKLSATGGEGAARELVTHIERLIEKR
jgi:lipid-A-disaccharide synthase